MPSEEQGKILRMVEAGRINAEEALKLIKGVEESATGSRPFEALAKTDSDKSRAADFEEIARRARRLWQIPLWAGVSILVLCSYWLNSLVNKENYGFWFYCAMALLMGGVLVLALFSGGRDSHWLYVRVDQARDEWPRRIVLGLPLPLGIASWSLRNFGQTIDGLNQGSVDEIVEFLSNGLS